MATDWFSTILFSVFYVHYRCNDRECGDQERCKYYGEAFDCYLKSNRNNGRIIQEFRKNSDKSTHDFALAQCEEWRKVFTHKQGESARWLLQHHETNHPMLVILIDDILSTASSTNNPIARTYYPILMPASTIPIPSSNIELDDGSTSSSASHPACVAATAMACLGGHGFE